MIEILYCDNHLLALNKPADLLTQPSGTGRDSLEERAKSWIKLEENKPGNVYLHAVHRLDAPVSGVVLFARSSKALSRLSGAFRQRSTHKTYLALVSSSPKELEKRLEHYLVHEEHQAKVVPQETPHAQLARLQYRVIGERAEGTLLEVHLETGRYHQIRAQLAFIGCPILNDRRYGGKPWPKRKGIALHHWCLEVQHPITQETLLIKAPLPKSWGWTCDNRPAST